MSADRRASLLANPWVQLAVGAVCVASVASLQYSWTLFVNPIEAEHHWAPAAIQVAFTLFVLLESWLNPLEGYVVDRSEPRYVVLCGAVLITLSWLLNSVANSLPLLYLGCALGGVGTGCVYVTCVGNAIKWFPARRGLAAGITAAAFGSGSAITIGPIAFLIQTTSYEHAFATFALIQGGLVAIMSSLIMVAPRSLQTARLNPEQTRRDYSPTEVLRSPIFYLLYLLYVLVSLGGLTLAASMGPIAHEMRVDNTTLRLLGVAMPSLVLALSLNRICDGGGRAFFGWLSDLIGRELTMAVAFILGGAALLMLESYGTSRLGFVLLTGLYFGVYGEIFSLFPATAADTFGARFATANIGMLYTAKGVGSLLVPVATSIAHSHGWGTVFSLGMCLNLIAALLAVFALAPMRERHFSEAARSAGAVFQAERTPGH
jgi:OFA family oxalate/formate antiporter-like MFS transporter